MYYSNLAQSTGRNEAVVSRTDEADLAEFQGSIYGLLKWEWVIWALFRVIMSKHVEMWQVQVFSRNYSCPDFRIYYLTCCTRMAFAVWAVMYKNISTLLLQLICDTHVNGKKMVIITYLNSACYTFFILYLLTKCTL